MSLYYIRNLQCVQRVFSMMDDPNRAVMSNREGDWGTSLTVFN